MSSTEHPRIIVSVTSFPKRIPFIAPCLQSLVEQKDKPDKIVLWLGEVQFPRRLEDVPPEVRAFSTECGGEIEFRFTRDLRSYTKLVPALQAFPDDAIITADDDTVYAPEMVGRLKAAFAQNPRAIHAHAVSDFFRSGGEWARTQGSFGFGKIGYQTSLRMMLGLGGVLYPPHSLHSMAFDAGLFTRLSPTNDDIWFWISAVRANTVVSRVPDALPRPTEIPTATSTDALSAINETDGDRKNMDLLRATLDHFPEIEAELLSSYCRESRTIALLRLRRFCLHYPRQIIYCLGNGGLRFLISEIRRAVGF
jgi:hypothetical protein